MYVDMKGEKGGDGVNDMWQETGIPRENPHVI